MSNKRDRKTEEKQKAIYDEYILILRGLGERAPYITKKELHEMYEQLADKYFVQSDYVRKVINGRGEVKKIKVFQ